MFGTHADDILLSGTPLRLRLFRESLDSRWGAVKFPGPPFLHCGVSVNIEADAFVLSQTDYATCSGMVALVNCGTPNEHTDEKTLDCM